MISADLRLLLSEREVISVATADFKGKPNAAPKFILKIQGDDLYLVDYTIGMTYENLKVNPQVSVSLFDLRTLIGYQLNGKARLIEAGAVYDRLSREVETKLIRLTAQHIVEDVRENTRKHENFEVGIPDRFIIIKIKLNEVVKIHPCGSLERGSVKAKKHQTDAPDTI